MKTVTMIARHGSKSKVTGYTLIGQDYKLMQMSASDLEKNIKEGKLEVTNLTVGAKGIESTNGALNKYTLFDEVEGKPIGDTRAVILNRVEKNEKLIGYVVYMVNGAIAELKVPDAVKLAVNGLLANGKVRHTQDGDIVSAIGGNYPLRSIKLTEAPEGKITVQLIYFCKPVGSKVEYAGFIVSSNSAVQMNKIVEQADKVNSKIISGVQPLTDDNLNESLGNKRIGANALFCVTDFGFIKKLVDAKASISSVSKEGMMVSSITYSKEGPSDEKVYLSKNWKVKKVDADASKEIKALTAKVIKSFGEVKVH